MEDKNMTALISCFARAYHTKNYKFKIFNDPLAEKILSDEEYENISNNMKNGISFFNPNFKGTDEEALRFIVDNQLSPSVLGRSAFTERSLLNSKKLGAKQYLIFASGYDTSFYKNNDLKVFEIDREEMINDKKKRLSNANIDYSNIEFIKADFTNDDWIELLLQSSYKRSEKAFCSLLGISYYLTKEEFENFISKISSVLQVGSEIVFDYPTFDETINEKLNQELAKAANEEMKSKYSLSDLEKILEKNNMLIYENLTSDDMNREYFQDYNILNPKHQIKAPKGVSYCLVVKR